MARAAVNWLASRTHRVSIGPIHIGELKLPWEPCKSLHRLAMRFDFCHVVVRLVFKRIQVAIVSTQATRRRDIHLSHVPAP